MAFILLALVLGLFTVFVGPFVLALHHVVGCIIDHVEVDHLVKAVSWNNLLVVACLAKLLLSRVDVVLHH